MTTCPQPEKLPRLPGRKRGVPMTLRWKKTGRQLVLFLFILALAFTAAGSFAHTARADSARQIKSVKIKWMTPDTVSDGNDARLSLRKLNNPSSPLSMQYQIDLILTGEKAHEPGSIRILVPKQIWHKRSDRADGSVLAEGYGDNTFSVPDTQSPGAAWHWEDAEDGQYAIVNDVAIDAAAQIKHQITITNIRMEDIMDMRPSDTLSVTVEATAPGGQKETVTSNELTAVIDTRAVLNQNGAALSATLYSTPENISSTLLSNLPGGPETANGYIYVCWKTPPYYDVSQYFHLDVDLWAGEAEGNGASIPGIVLSRGSGGRVNTQESGEQAGQHYAKAAAIYSFDKSGMDSSKRAEKIWVAYPVAQMQANKTYTIRSAATWKMTEADPARGNDLQEVTTAGATASVEYTHSEWVYPKGTFGVYKYTDSHPGHTHSTISKDGPDNSTNSKHRKNVTYEMSIGALRNGKTVSLEYEVLTVGYGYAYTAGPTEEVPDLPEDWEFDPTHYLNWNYMMETTDSELWPQHIVAPLMAGDYRFDGITVAAPEMFTYGRLQPSQSLFMLEGTTFGYKPDSSLAKPAVEVWIAKNGSDMYELLDTVQVNSGTLWVPFPDNVTGYRTRILTNQAACKLAVWPKVTLLPSENMMILADTLLPHYSNIVLENKVHLKTLYYYSPVRQDEVLPSQAAWLEAAAESEHVVETNDSSLATLNAAGFKVSGAAETEAVVNDTVNRRVKISIAAHVDEESNLSSEELYKEAVALGAIIPETSGTWYILLPKYMVPNTSSIKLRKDSGCNDRIVSVEVTENFRNTGRTLVTVRATMTPHLEHPYSLRGYMDRIRIHMDVYLSWTDYQKLPSSKYVDYYVAFESGNPGRLGNLPDTNGWSQTIGYPDAWPNIQGLSLNSAPRDMKNAMTDLDPDSDDERFVYAIGGFTLNNPDISDQVEFRKDARADALGVWGKGTAGESQVTVTEGGTYTYRLNIATKGDSKTASIILYDAIEEHVPTDESGLDEKKAWSGKWNGKGQWQGTLTSVDLRELINMNCAPVLYYSTEPGLVFGRTGSVNPDDTGILQISFTDWDSSYNLNNQNIWECVEADEIIGGIWNAPGDKHVTAIAVDARRGKQDASAFALWPGQNVSVYLHMKAPDDVGTTDTDPDTWRAKGAYARKTDNASSADEIDWDAVDTIEAGEHWLAVLGVRWDRFDADYRSTDGKYCFE